MTLQKVLEALVFGSPKPLTGKELATALREASDLAATEETRQLAESTVEEITSALGAMQAEYVETGRGFRLLEQANGWTFVTNPEASAWVKQLYPEAKPTRLSGPALETLAIIAYRQPVTRADVEVVRGVAVDGVMQVLLDRGLVKITGRADFPGRPLLYGTTEYFLQHFGLKTTDELPNSDELRRVALPTAPVPTEEEVAPKRKRKSDAAPEPMPPSEPSSPDAVAADDASNEATAVAEERVEPPNSESAEAPEPPAGEPASDVTTEPTPE